MILENRACDFLHALVFLTPKGIFFNRTQRFVRQNAGNLLRFLAKLLVSLSASSRGPKFSRNEVGHQQGPRDDKVTPPPTRLGRCPDLGTARRASAPRLLVGEDSRRWPGVCAVLRPGELPRHRCRGKSGGAKKL